AILFSVTHQHEEAEKIYHKLGDDEEMISNNLGETMLALFRFSEAEKQYQRVLKAQKPHPGTILTVWNMVNLYFFALDLTQASKTLNSWIQANKNTFEFHESTGLIALMRAMMAYKAGYLGNAFAQVDIARSNPQFFGGMGMSPKEYQQALDDL